MSAQKVFLMLKALMMNLLNSMKLTFENFNMEWNENSNFQLMKM